MSDVFNGSWSGIHHLSNKRYSCGHCGDNVLAQEGYPTSNTTVYICICHGCNKPTFFYKGGTQIPAPKLGRDIAHLPEDVSRLYKEIQDAASQSAFSLAIIGGRKLIMHLAVSHGAKENKSFKEYVEYLDSAHYIPPNSEPWVDKIRTMGNDTNHQIIFNQKEDAETMINFLEMLMTFMYEYGGSPENSPAEE